VGWQEEFIQNWEETGQHWGVPKAMLSVHAWLLLENEPRSTDDVMEALALSRGSAHSMLHLLVEWKLAYPIQRWGSRQVRFLAEADPWTMLLAIAEQRTKRELGPLVSLALWNDRNSQQMKRDGKGELHEHLKSISTRAMQVQKTLEFMQREDEKRWWKWLLAPLRTK